MTAYPRDDTARDVTAEEARKLADDWHSASLPHRNAILNLAAQVERLTAERDRYLKLLDDDMANGVKLAKLVFDTEARSIALAVERDRLTADLETASDELEQLSKRAIAEYDRAERLTAERDRYLLASSTNEAQRGNAEARAITLAAERDALREMLEDTRAVLVADWINTREGEVTCAECGWSGKGVINHDPECVLGRIDALLAKGAEHVEHT